MRHRFTKKSRFLSRVLRHHPEHIGVTLDAGGWADIGELLSRASEAGRQITREELDHIVATDEKGRYAISEDGTRIRANQGHSIAVDLGLEPIEPPELLFHGTASKSLESIGQQGLVPRSRQHVHLSGDAETAVKVGKRHGTPVVLEILARAMHAEGHTFRRSANGVWLVDAVPVEFIRFPSEPNPHSQPD